MSLTFSDKLFTATLGALNAELRIPLNSASGVRIDVRGTFTATFALEATMDGTNWTTVQTAGGASVFSYTGVASTFSAVGNYVSADVGGFTEIRVRCSAYTSGAATVVVALTEENQVDQVGIVGTTIVQLGTGTNPVGSVSNIDNIFYNDSTTAQAGGATLTGTARDVGVAAAANHRYSAFNVSAFADQAGTVRIECSNDNTTWRRASADTAVGVSACVILSVPIMTRYYRAVYVNGATIQTQFMLNTSFTAS